MIILDKTTYLHDYDSCYIKHVIKEIYGYIGFTDQLQGVDREYETAMAHDKNRTFFADILGKKSIGELIQSAKDSQNFQSDPKGKLPDEIKFVQECIKRLHEQKIILVIDDFEILRRDENKIFLQKIKDLINAEGIIPLFVMYTDTFNDLKEKQDELLKDYAALEVLPLTTPELKEMLIRRMFYFTDKDIPADPLSHSNEMFTMFKDRTLDIIGDASKGNPLKFIMLLKDTIALANEKNEKNLNEEMAKSIIFESISVPENLSTIQKQVFEFVKERGEVTIEDVKRFHGKSKIAAFFILKGLYEIRLLDKKRQGREMKYFIKSQ